MSSTKTQDKRILALFWWRNVNLHRNLQLWSRHSKQEQQHNFMQLPGSKRLDMPLWLQIKDIILNYFDSFLFLFCLCFVRLAFLISCCKPTFQKPYIYFHPNEYYIRVYIQMYRIYAHYRSLCTNKIFILTNYLILFRVKRHITY